MSKSKIIGLIALICLALSVSASPTAVGAEKGKIAGRIVRFAPGFESASVPDVEGHTIYLLKMKGIFFSDKWGTASVILRGTADLIKGAGTLEGYDQYTFPDGSTITSRWKGTQKGAGAGITGGAGGEATWTYVKGTGKFAGIKGEGTSKFWIVAPGQTYTDFEGEYTLP